MESDVKGFESINSHHNLAFHKFNFEAPEMCSMPNSFHNFKVSIFNNLPNGYQTITNICQLT